MGQTLMDVWLAHGPVLSVLLPSFTAMALLLLGDHGGLSGVGGGHGARRWAWRRREARYATAHADSADQRSAPTGIFAKLRFFAETNAPHEIPI